MSATPIEFYYKRAAEKEPQDITSDLEQIELTIRTDSNASVFRDPETGPDTRASEQTKLIPPPPETPPTPEQEAQKAVTVKARRKSKYADDTGRATITEEKEKDWCNVYRVFIETLGKLSPTMQ